MTSGARPARTALSIASASRSEPACEYGIPERLFGQLRAIGQSAVRCCTTPSATPILPGRASLWQQDRGPVHVLPVGAAAVAFRRPAEDQKPVWGIKGCLEDLA